jgi:hypothetical protein
LICSISCRLHDAASSEESKTDELARAMIQEALATGEA